MIYNKLYEYYMMYFEEGADKEIIFIEITKIIKPIIYSNIFLVKKNYREDFHQDLLMKIHYTLEYKKFILDFNSKINYDEIENELKTKSDKIIFENFKNEYIENIQCKDKRIIVMDFNRYLGNVKLFSFFEKTIKNFRIDFNKKNSKFEIISLDSPEYANLEIIYIRNDVECEIMVKKKTKNF